MTAALNLCQLLEKLKDYSDSALVFRFEGEDISGGYHLTEFKKIDVSSIDCGTHLHQWTEVRMQLLDGGGGAHMRVAKFSNIATKSVAALGDLANQPFLIEFAPRNQGLRQLLVDDVVLDGNRAVVTLVNDRAACKPFTAGTHALAKTDRHTKSVTSLCCGTSRVSAGACCAK